MFEHDELGSAGYDILQDHHCVDRIGVHELVDLGAKTGCLEFLIKSGLNRIPVDAPFMMMMMVCHLACVLN